MNHAEAAGAFLQESDYIPTQMETQNSIMKKKDRRSETAIRS